MELKKKNMGVGSLSLPLVIFAIIFGVSFKNNVAIGDRLLRFIGLKAWSNEYSGTHYTAFYSLVLIGVGWLIGSKFKTHWGAKVGKTVASIVVWIIAISIIIQMLT
jgi:hypothetical protein